MNLIDFIRAVSPEYAIKLDKIMPDQLMEDRNSVILMIQCYNQFIFS